ncbi:hypothetical protein [Candidatus Enterovibrio escicola]|uniref:hypothetical protein n=1 Tax=Candidatus Enterovibrio escicola TaxID=1927127 RepID=UPI001237F9AB|nr:hypothetical protein [Candidatus Enterovibrio escacola]
MKPSRFLKEDKLAERKKDKDYHKLSSAETAIFCHKELLSHKITLLDYNNQVGVALENMKEINKVIKLDMPVRQ